MVWFKRLAPFVIIATLLTGYWRYSDHRNEEKAAYEHKLALATAQIWIASGTFRSDPEQFLHTRDSILAACSLSAGDVRSFVDRNIDRPEELYQYTKFMQEFVDSLLDIRDSLATAAPNSPQ